MSFIVVANRPTSSSAGGTGTRRWRSAPADRRDLRANSLDGPQGASDDHPRQQSEHSSRQRDGDEERLSQRGDAVIDVVARGGDVDRRRPVGGVDNAAEQPHVVILTARYRPDPSDRPLAGCLAECRTLGDRRAGRDDIAVCVHHLGDPVVLAEQRHVGLPAGTQVVSDDVGDLRHPLVEAGRELTAVVYDETPAD
jgi:hypothetical protein